MLCKSDSEEQDSGLKAVEEPHKRSADCQHLPRRLRACITNPHDRSLECPTQYTQQQPSRRDSAHHSWQQANHMVACSVDTMVMCSDCCRDCAMSTRSPGWSSAHNVAAHKIVF